MDGIAQELFRAWGDRADRARMRADLSMRQSHPPRGMGIITGEDLPSTGQSGTARTFLVEVKPGDVPANKTLSHAQLLAREGVLAEAMRGYIDWLIPQAQALPLKLSGHFQALRDDVNSKCAGLHGRSPEAIAWLQLGLEKMFEYFEAQGALASEDACAICASGFTLLRCNARDQHSAMQEEEPARMFLDALRELKASGTATFIGLSGGALGSLLCTGAMCGHVDDTYDGLLAGIAYGMVQEHYRPQLFPISKPQL